MPSYNSITKPDPNTSDGIPAPVNQFSYNPTTKLMESWKDATWTAGDLPTAQFHYDTAQRITSIDEHDNSSQLTSVQSQGSYDASVPGNLGSQSNPAHLNIGTAPLMGSEVDHHGVSSTFSVDRFGHETSVIDALGNHFTYERDANGLVTRMVTPSPNAFTGAPATLATLLEYDSAGNVTKMTLPDGATRYWRYDPVFNQVTRYIDELGRVTLYDIDPASGNLRSMTEVVGGIDSQSGENDDLTWTYTYTTAADGIPRGMLKTVTDPLNHLTRYKYFNTGLANKFGQLQSIVYAEGTLDEATEQFDYDTQGNVNLVIDGEGRTTSYQFDTLDRLTRVTLPDIDGVGTTTPLMLYAYDQASRVVKVTDSVDPVMLVGNETISVYDEHGRLEKLIEEDPTARGLPEAQRPTTTFFYNETTDRLDHVVDAMGRQTDFGYDSLGRTTTVTLNDPDGAGLLQRTVYSTSYGALGDVLYEQAGVFPYEYTYASYHVDNRGRVDTVTLPDTGGGSPVYQTVYDAAGQVIKQISPGATTATADDLVTRSRYDALGRPVRTHNPASGTTSLVYDKNSNLTSQTDTLGRTTSMTYDFRDRQKTVTDPRTPVGGVTSFAYDRVNNMTRLTDADNNATIFAYNNWNLLKQERNQLDQNQSLPGRLYVYGDVTGDLARMTDRNGRITDYTHDNQHRLTSEVWKDSGGNTVNTINHGYNLDDELTSISDGNSYYGYTRDGLGRATSITNTNTPGSPTVVLAQQFDQLSRRTQLSATVDTTADFQNTYAWDALSRMKSVRQWDVSGGNSVAHKQVLFNYNLIGQFTSIYRQAGATLSEYVASSEYGYDAGTQRLTSLKHSSAPDANGDLASYTWTFDTLGRVRSFFSANDSGDTARYGYDQTDQVVSVTHSVLTTENESYGYDLNGNRTDHNNTPSANNRLQSDGTYAYVYDGEGNLTRRTENATGNYVQYSWDHRNRLTQVDFMTVGNQLQKRVVYTYDVFDRRIGKKVDTSGDGAFDRSERYVYDEGRDMLFAFLDADGDGTALGSSLATRYLNGALVDQVPVEEAVDTANGASLDVFWPLADNLGSNRDVVHRAGGATVSVEHLRFDSFGKILADNNPAYTQRQSYAGMELDADVGLYYAQHRWYDAVTHRFISEDPMGFAAGDKNLSRYVANSSPNAADPTGLGWVADVIEWLISQGETARGQELDRQRAAHALRDAQSNTSDPFALQKNLPGIRKMGAEGLARDAQMLAAGSVEFTAAGLGGAFVGPSAAARGACSIRSSGTTAARHSAADSGKLLAARSSILNRRGVPYPTIIDPRSGRAVPFPDTIIRTPLSSRVPWGPAERQAFISEWQRRGFAEPCGGWAAYDIHHITPREWGGTNAFENLVPVERTLHQQTVTPWWNNFSGR